MSRMCACLVLVMAAALPAASPAEGQVQAYKKRFAPGTGVRVLEFAPEANAASYVEDRLVVLGMTANEEVEFLPAKSLPGKGFVVTAKLSIRGQSALRNELAARLQKDFGKDAAPVKLPVDSFALWAAAGDRIVWERENAAGNLQEIPLQFFLPSVPGVKRPKEVRVVGVLGVQQKVRSASKQLTINWKALVDAFQAEAKKSNGMLTETQIQALLRSAVEREWVRTEDGPKVSSETVVRMNVLWQAVRTSLLKEPKPVRLDDEEAPPDLAFQVVERVELSKLVSVVELTRLKTVVTPIKVAGKFKVRYPDE